MLLNARRSYATLKKPVRSKLVYHVYTHTQRNSNRTIFIKTVYSHIDQNVSFRFSVAMSSCITSVNTLDEKPQTE